MSKVQGGMKCVKYLLFVFNFIFWVSRYRFACELILWFWFLFLKEQEHVFLFCFLNAAFAGMWERKKTCSPHRCLVYILPKLQGGEIVRLSLYVARHAWFKLSY